MRVHSWWQIGLGETGRNWLLGLAFAFSSGACLCISQTLFYCDRIPDRTHLREKGFIWLTVSGVLFQGGGETVVEPSSSHDDDGQQAGRGQMPTLAVSPLFFPLISLGALYLLHSEQAVRP